MRAKSTIYSPEYHNQFQESEEQIKLDKAEKAEHQWKDEREGQSAFRVDKVKPGKHKKEMRVRM